MRAHINKSVTPNERIIRKVLEEYGDWLTVREVSLLCGTSIGTVGRILHFLFERGKIERDTVFLGGFRYRAK